MDITHTEIDDEIEHSFAGDVFCSCSSFKTPKWIIDIRATDHIVPNYERLTDVKNSSHITYIKKLNSHMQAILNLRMTNTLCGIL